MAIAFDASSSGSSVINPPTSSSLTISHTCGSGLQNTLLIVLAAYYGNPVSGNITSITYNGVGLTKIQRNNNGAQAASTEAWYLLNPSTGANNIVFNLSAGIGAGTYLNGFGYSFSNTIQTSSVIEAQSSTPNVTTGTHSTMSTSVTTVAANAWLADVIAVPNAATAGGSQTNVLNLNPGTAEDAAASLRGPILTPGSTAMSWSWTSSSVATAQTVISIAPIAGGWLVGGLLVNRGAGVAGGGQ